MVKKNICMTKVNLYYEGGGSANRNVYEPTRVELRMQDGGSGKLRWAEVGCWSGMVYRWLD